MPHLVVILGAGASRACSPRPDLENNEDFLPPLTADLFDPRYEVILNNYPLASAAASDIRVAVSSGAVAIERFLREELRDSSDEYARRRYLQIPLYLHELLTAVSFNYTDHPDNYDRLVNAGLGLDSVTFVTLNYDVIFDRRLELQTGTFNHITDYVGNDSWALVKLHGSVNWARLVPGIKASSVDSRMVSAFTELAENLDRLSQPEIHLRTLSPDMQNFRYDDKVPALFYPALSVPLGSEDELVCPPEHVDILRKRLESHDGLNLLVIGYSGIDVEVLKLLRESKNDLRSLFVVNNNVAGAEAAARSILEQFGGRDPTEAEVASAEFNGWAQSNELRDYFRALT